MEVDPDGPQAYVGTVQGRCISTTLWVLKDAWVPCGQPGTKGCFSTPGGERRTRVCLNGCSARCIRPTIHSSDCLGAFKPCFTAHALEPSFRVVCLGTLSLPWAKIKGPPSGVVYHGVKVP
eukprot:6234903-Pyramimonas_sp.AAC.2